MLSVDLFDYALPPELIAQYPAERRDMSRMMVLDRRTGECEIHPFRDICGYLSPGDALICNNTKVLRGRMFARRNGRTDGAVFEVLLVEKLSGNPNRWKVLLKPGKRAAEGVFAVLTDADGQLNRNGDKFTVTRRRTDGSFEVEFSLTDDNLLQAEYGHIPLPPYIARPDDNADAGRYQTVYASVPGAVAAPTAGLHFTGEILTELAEKGVRESAVTLHVGPGTFKPVSVNDVSKHIMHEEEYWLSDTAAGLINSVRAAGRKVLAVGTTTVRVLESCAAEDGTVTPGHGRTRIFLYPPRRIKAVDMLLTNFHLPKSTLIMLVSCFCEREKVLAAYAKAIEAKMRFYSYGDCMLLK